MGGAEGPDTRWVARVKPLAGVSVDDLLGLPLGLDVWERHDDGLVVAASRGQLSMLEDRRLAEVEQLSTVDDVRPEPEGGPR